MKGNINGIFLAKYKSMAVKAFDLKEAKFILAKYIGTRWHVTYNYNIQYNTLVITRIINCLA